MFAQCSRWLAQDQHGKQTPPCYNVRCNTSGMSAKVFRFPASQRDADLYDYVRPVQSAPPEPRSRAQKGGEHLASRKISDDWPDHVPVTDAELDLFEVHFGPILDELLGSKN